MPTPPVTKTLVPSADVEAFLQWRYTTQKPADDWFKPGFDDSGWKSGTAGFGTQGTPGAVVRTEWSTPNVWMRREFTLPEGTRLDPQLWLHHDEDAEVYLNGVAAATVSGYTTGYETVAIRAEAKATLRAGKNVIAIHCRQTGGGQYIDAGLVDTVPVGKK